MWVFITGNVDCLFPILKITFMPTHFTIWAQYFWITLLVAYFVWYNPKSPPYPIHHIFLVTNSLIQSKEMLHFLSHFVLAWRIKTLYNVDSYSFALLQNTRIWWFTSVILTPFASHKRMEIGKIYSTASVSIHELYFLHHLFV